MSTDLGSVDENLERYRALAKANGIALVGGDGRVLGSVGSGHEAFSHTALAMRAFAASVALEEVADAVSKDGLRCSLLDGTGPQSLALALVGNRGLLVVAFDRHETTSAMVLFYLKELVDKLNVLLRMAG